MRKNGVTLLAAALLAAAAPAAAQSVDPDQALKMMLDGNNRYVSGAATRPHQTEARRQEVAKGQKPFAMVLSCADSRVPPEILFDQGLGDLFVVRVAGNIATNEGIGSLEYGAAVLGARLVMVLGHEYCGAVDAAFKGQDVPGNIKSVVSSIAPAVAHVKAKPNPTLDAATVENVKIVLEAINSKSTILSDMVKKGTMKIVGASYDLDTGHVSLVDAARSGTQSHRH